MNENTFYWNLGGFYVALSELPSFIGFAFTCAYIRDDHIFQVMLHMGTIALAIGYDFKGID